MDNYTVKINGTDRILYNTMKYEDLNGFLDPHRLFSFDIESNAKAMYTPDYKLVGFSVANSPQSGIYVCFESLEADIDPDERFKIDEYLKEHLTTKKIVVHNMQHERASIRTVYDLELPYETVDDTLFMSRLLLGGKSGSGLKQQARERLNYPDWETDLYIYFEHSKNLLKYWIDNGITEVEELVDNESFTVLKYLLLEYGCDPIPTINISIQ